MDDKKIALFGGTFDPIHLGHTIVAAKAAEHIGARRVIFIPAKSSPLKDSSPQVSAQHRLQMVTLAIANINSFEVSDYEVKKDSPDYTLHTVRHFQVEFGSSASIFWLAGADSVDDFPNWYKIEELIDECNLCVMFRAGCDAPDFSRFKSLWGAERIKKLQQNTIDTPLVEISSTEIRRRLASGLDVTEMVDRKVCQYITNNGLYRSR
ncbi:MAG: nicotinate (nicotinamide) nucleotide adenylyltransferase [Sedimentisphaerales bacterium]|nr:nicotinate (nicotinamide) nucleotide adenylyltransferase [Sedimentisphaerales bacterium]